MTQMKNDAPKTDVEANVDAAATAKIDNVKVKVKTQEELRAEFLVEHADLTEAFAALEAEIKTADAALEKEAEEAKEAAKNTPKKEDASVKNTKNDDAKPTKEEVEAAAAEKKEADAKKEAAAKKLEQQKSVLAQTKALLDSVKDLAPVEVKAEEAAKTDDKNAVNAEENKDAKSEDKKEAKKEVKAADYATFTAVFASAKVLVGNSVTFNPEKATTVTLNEKEYKKFAGNLFTLNKDNAYVVANKAGEAHTYETIEALKADMAKQAQGLAGSTIPWLRIVGLTVLALALSLVLVAGIMALATPVGAGLLVAGIAATALSGLSVSIAASGVSAAAAAFLTAATVLVPVAAVGAGAAYYADQRSGQSKTVYDFSKVSQSSMFKPAVKDAEKKDADKTAENTAKAGMTVTG